MATSEEQLQAKTDELEKLVAQNDKAELKRRQDEEAAARASRLKAIEAQIEAEKARLNAPDPVEAVVRARAAAARGSKSDTGPGAGAPKASEEKE